MSNRIITGVRSLTRTPLRQSKFRNVPTRVDGIRFASKLEAKRYGELKLLERAGHIRSLKCQPEFDLDIDGQAFGIYRGDFAYVELFTPGNGALGGRTVCEDSKGVQTPLFKLKFKLAKALYPNVVFRIVT